MTALPIRGGVNDPLASPAPEPLRRLLHQANLAYPPASLHDLRFDTDHGPDGQKTLVAFTADRAELIGFIASSPGLRFVAPLQHSGPPGPVLAVVGRRAPEPDEHGGGESALAEPDFPWWGPEPHGRGRRYAYSTPSLDFVEVIIDEPAGRVFIRTIN